MSILSHKLDDIFKLRPDTPEELVLFHEWHQKSGGVINKEFVELSTNLTLCAMNATHYSPPEFNMIGVNTQSRKNFGSDWANSATRTQTTPIRSLDEISAAGYMRALSQCWSYDLIEFDELRYFGAYRRMIVPISIKAGLKPSYFAMMLHFEHFENKH